MRTVALVMIVLLVGVFAGCGGSGGEDQALAARRNQLTVTYFHWLLTLPQVGGTAQAYYQATARLWQPQEAPLLSDLSLSLASSSATVALYGPQLFSPTDGANQTGAPIDVYWGGGDTIPAGQPVTVPPGGWKPGFVNPPDDLYAYTGVIDFTEPQSIAGVLALAGQQRLAQQWTVPEGTVMLPAAAITMPAQIAVNSLHPFLVAWNAVPGAAGYLVNIEGTKKDQDGNLLRTVVWTSAARPIVFDAVPDLTADLLPADARQTMVPARVFRGCGALQVNVFAQAAPIVDTTTRPSLRLLNGSRATKIVVLFEQ